MKRTIYCLTYVAVIFALIFFPQQSYGQAPEGIQGPAWQTSTPEKQGMDSETLAQLFSFVKQNNTAIHSLQVVRNGYLILDAYFYPFGPNLVHDCASVTKSITSLLIGIAIDKGFIKSVDEPVIPIFSDRAVLNPSEYKSKLSIRSLLTMSSSLSTNSDNDEDLLLEMRSKQDWIQFILNRPIESPPDTQFHYCSINFHLLAGIIKKKTGLTPKEFAQRHLFSPLGIKNVFWPSDPDGINFGWGDLHLLPTDMAKIGYLCLNKGKWGNEQVISSGWITQSTQPHVRIAADESYGFGWWIRPRPSPGIYEAYGRAGQRIVMWPSKNMVLVFTGSNFEPAHVGRFVVDAVKSDSALQENPRAFDLLQSRIKEATRQPAPITSKALPAIARKINGKDFQFADNQFGFNTVRFNFSGKDEGVIRIVKANSVLEIPFGLDGVYRTSLTGDFNLPRLARASWYTDQRLILYLNQVCRMNLEVFDITFDKDKLVMERENMKVEGRLKQ